MLVLSPCARRYAISSCTLAALTLGPMTSTFGTVAKSVTGLKSFTASQQQGVAVRRRGGHLLGGDGAVGPALVVDDDGLAQRLGRFGRDRSCQDVGRAAGRMRHHERDGFGGEGLRVRRRQCRRQTGGQRNARQQSGTEHGSLLGCC
ncbi:hypothetical protein G6F66_014359 [Rhizopus arrhizus]|nr:hypothetical protein G6F66_014359 [Rhizopus arrhizus]